MLVRRVGKHLGVGIAPPVDLREGPVWRLGISRASGGVIFVSVVFDPSRRALDLLFAGRRIVGTTLFWVFIRHIFRSLSHRVGGQGRRQRVNAGAVPLYIAAVLGGQSNESRAAEGRATNTVSNTNAYIPDWLEGYTQNAVGRASDLSNQAYTPYSGDTIAGIDPAQQQAYNQIGAMQGMGAGGWNSAISADQTLAGQASPVTAGGIQAGTNTLQQGFNSQVYNPAQGLLGAYASQGPATAAGVGANASQLMSPYTQNVIDPMLQAGEQQQLARAKQSIAGQGQQRGRVRR